MEADSITTWNPETFAWLHQQIITANATGSLNCLFSNGDYLFAYFDQNGYNSLCYLPRQAPYGPVRCPDVATDIDLTTIYPATAAGVIVATKPLTSEKWTPFQAGQLLVFKDGIRVFSTIFAGAK